jgi:hypothetical protein
MKLQKWVSGLLLLAIVYLLAAPLLLFIEAHISGTAQSLRMALPTAIIATVFFAYSLGMSAFQQRLLRTKSTFLTAFYLFNNLLRLFLAALLLVGYAVLASREGLRLFAIHLVVYYLLTIIFTARSSIQAEQQNHHAE